MTTTPEQTALYAALCELIYVRDPMDQALTLGELDPDLSYVNVSSDPTLIAAGIFKSGDYYYSDRGFCGTIVRDGDSYTVVLRGTDVGPVDPISIGTGFATGISTDSVDAEDMRENYYMGKLGSE